MASMELGSVNDPTWEGILNRHDSICSDLGVGHFGSLLDEESPASVAWMPEDDAYGKASPNAHLLAQMYKRKTRERSKSIEHAFSPGAGERGALTVRLRALATLEASGAIDATQKGALKDALLSKSPAMNISLERFRASSIDVHGLDEVPRRSAARPVGRARSGSLRDSMLHDEGDHLVESLGVDLENLMSLDNLDRSHSLDFRCGDAEPEPVAGSLASIPEDVLHDLRRQADPYGSAGLSLSFTDGPLHLARETEADADARHFAEHRRFSATTLADAASFAASLLPGASFDARSPPGDFVQGARFSAGTLSARAVTVGVLGEDAQFDFDDVPGVGAGATNKRKLSFSAPPRPDDAPKRAELAHVKPEPGVHVKTEDGCAAAAALANPGHGMSQLPPGGLKSGSRQASLIVEVRELPPLEAVSSGNAPPYDDLINYARTKGRGQAHHCVMCGREGRPPTADDAALPPGIVVIPTQNKDVCKVCDTVTWQHRHSGVFFKWCKGCKRFHNLQAFAGKLKASKCDASRARGRAGYMRRKDVPNSPGSSPTAGLDLIDVLGQPPIPPLML
mmetsp:Transcript_23814/g.80332  ORF Transcript_23814/g.80332 Transcript_23814/m.80332 type:complete len:566 (-) Transcript_23814:186-1883(-)